MKKEKNINQKCSYPNCKMELGRNNKSGMCFRHSQKSRCECGGWKTKTAVRCIICMKYGHFNGDKKNE